MTLRTAGLVLISSLVCTTASLAQQRGTPPSKPVREKDLLPDPMPAKDQQPADTQGTALKRVDLRPKFEKGQELKYTLTMSSSTTQTPLNAKPSTATPAAPAKRTPAPGIKRPASPPPSSTPTKPPTDDSTPDAAAPSDTTSKVTMGLKLKVVDASVEGGATVDLVIETVKATITAADTTLDFDSTKPAKAPKADDPAAMLFQSIAGAKLTMKVDRNGNITSVTGGDALAALGQMAGGVGSAASAKPGDLFSSLFSTGKVSGEAAVGESWENSDSIDSPLMGGFHMTTRHTLTSVHGSDATVDVRGRVDPSTEAPGSSPFTIKNVRHDGHYVWDTKSGSLRQMTSTMSSEIQAKIGDQEISARSESKMDVNRQR